MSELLIFGAPLLAATEGGHAVSIWGFWVYVLLVAGAVLVAMALAKQGLKERVFHKPITSAFEQVYLFVEQMCVNTIGSHGRKYIPIIMTFWLVIFVGNIVALFFPFSPTADLSFNLGMALTSILYVQWEGIRSNGFFGHFRHFAGPKLGGVLVVISAMIFVIELISEMMKNVSLSLRLYGNIHGGHEAVVAMNKLGEQWLIPFGEFLIPIKLLTVVVQALIFTLLTCVYLSLVTHHDEHTDEDESHGQAVHPATVEHLSPV